jgi:hypothetical protein
MNRCVIIALLSLVAGCGTQPAFGPQAASGQIPDYVRALCGTSSDQNILSTAQTIAEAIRDYSVSRRDAISLWGDVCADEWGWGTYFYENCYNCHIAITDWVYR